MRLNRKYEPSGLSFYRYRCCAAVSSLSSWTLSLTLFHRDRLNYSCRRATVCQYMVYARITAKCSRWGEIYSPCAKRVNWNKKKKKKKERSMYWYMYCHRRHHHYSVQPLPFNEKLVLHVTIFTWYHEGTTSIFIFDEFFSIMAKTKSQISFLFRRYAIPLTSTSYQHTKERQKYISDVFFFSCWIKDFCRRIKTTWKYHR